MSTLFERLGGQPSVDAIVDLLYDRMTVDARVRHFFERIDMSRQRKMQKSFLTKAFGGPDHYVGRDMRRSHKHLKLERRDFVTVVDILDDCMKELDVPEGLRKEVGSVIYAQYNDVMNL